ncbi:alpha carbonic anhydrase 7-like [Cynara cardunculus var. scolymus]|uniref:alpha carbonic anhydrase 7-like n=1 Tax=Cynara cardunculus var. scolymus TaxID=59895 RepID=UPI000D62C49F|nr:alpha carbonic anhydrase 7-like [Cynara cardunculus var. scolymus]
MKNMKSSSILVLGFLLFMLIFSHPSTTQAQEVEDEREFDYARGSHMGPEKWGAIKKEWSLCSNGTMQSPIDMSSRRVAMVATSTKLYRNYKPRNATINNRGHDIMLQWEGDAGSIRISGTNYALKQAHWHSPSEHTINGRRYDMELHMVHVSIDYKIAVIAVLYNIGKPDSFLSKLAVNISSMIDEKGEHGHSGIISPKEIQMSSRRYYRYVGSLTVPPCTEGVVWTISRKIRTVSKGQVKLLREAVHDYAANNARPVQPHNERDTFFYGPDTRQ